MADLLASCVGRLNSRNPALLRKDIDKLRRYIGRPMPEAEARHYRQLIKEHELLREHLPVDVSLRSALYKALLQLAFPVPLRYSDYCAVEACVSDKPTMHAPLARVIRDIGLDGVVTNLLVEKELGDRSASQVLREKNATIETILTALTGSSLQSRHAGFICATSVDFICSSPPSGASEQQARRTALHKHGYLAPVLQRLYDGTPQYQLKLLRRLLSAAYSVPPDGILGRPEIGAILRGGKSAPTPALLAAVLSMSDAGDTELVEWTVVHGLIEGAGFEDDTRKRLIRQLLSQGAPAPGEPGGKTHRKPRTLSDDVAGAWHAMKGALVWLFFAGAVLFLLAVIALKLVR